MSKQQSKRRRRRYQPASAYAGDVRPTGVLGVLGSQRTIAVIFIVMALALIAGGAASIFAGDIFSGGSGDNPAGFVLPEDREDNGDAPQLQDPEDVRRYGAPPSMVIDTSNTYLATIKTELGDIQVELLDDQAPETVNNFVFLARDGFYDGLAFHYAVEGFSANAGDPACRAGSTERTCDGGPGYDFPPEAPGEFAPGTLGMINGSQFFIALGPAEQFDQFTPFGRIVSGLEVAQQLTRGTGIASIEIAEQ